MKRKATGIVMACIISASMLAGCGASINLSAPAAEAPVYIEPEKYEEEPVRTPEYDEEVACAESADSASTMEASGTVYYGEDYACAEEESCTDYGYEDEVYATSKQAVNGYCTTYDESALCPGDYVFRIPEADHEKYDRVRENSFTDVATSPLSTFSADVDTASYSNLRRMINDGYGLRDIPFGSIRTEELINYFNYDYKEPKSGDAFAINASIIDCPWNKKTKLVNLGVKAKEYSDTSDIPSNIVFLIDVSGSMEDPDKLPLLQMGFDMLVDDLNENDRVSIVTYASSSDVIIAGVPGNEHTKIKRAIRSLEASGATNGGDGIKTAYRLANKYFIKGGNNRVIMATDGDLNVGITSQDELEELITDKKEGGVFLSVLGFGTGNYNEATLERLADKGNGNYSYIDCLAEAKKVLIDEFDSTLFTIAKDVKFQIEFNPKYVDSYRQIGYENRQMAAKDFNDDTKDGGEVGSGHAITVIYEVKLTGDADDDEDDVKLKYQEAGLSQTGADSDEWMTVSVRYKEPEKDTSKLLAFPISKKCYTNRPKSDTLFAAYVAEAGMILNESEYVGDMDMRDVAKQLSRIDLDDEYKEEFAQLIEQL